MSEIKFDNGDIANIKVIPFILAMKLKNSLLKNAADAKISLSSLKGLKMEDEMTLSILEPLINVIMVIDSSEDFNIIIMECFQRCLYNGEKITESLFETNMKARESYYLMVIELLKVNISPFFKGLVSVLQAQFSSLLPSLLK